MSMRDDVGTAWNPEDQLFIAFLSISGDLHYANGDKYDGEWQLNVPSGEGIYTTATGLVYKGGWLTYGRRVALPRV